MSVQRLDVYGVRNILHASILPSPGLNFIYGNNGSGKSSLLEAIFILGRAGSFRSSHIKYVINHNASALTVSGRVQQSNGFDAHLGVQLDPKNCEIHINQMGKQKRVDLAHALPIQLIYPASYQLLDGGSADRREFMDWGVFNHDRQFLALWRKFKKSLLQRNALLKANLLHGIEVWDKELVLYALPVARLRSEYLQMLQPIFSEICQYFLAIEADIQLKISSGWDEQKDLQQLLSGNLIKDCRYGFTQHGPHRGDFQLLINGRFAKDVVSRGQLKLLILSLKLAQMQLLRLKFSNIGCVLIDDLASELDFDNRVKLLRYLAAMDFQVFLTVTDLQCFGKVLTEFDGFKMFHVEHGCVKQENVSRGTLF